MKRKINSVRNLLWLGFLAIIGVVILIHFTGIPVEYSNGQRTGVPQKLSYKGIFCKTWEGSLNVGGMSTDGQGIAVPNVWNFSVPNEAIAGEINSAADQGKRLTLHYTQPLLAATCKGSSGYYVYKVSY